MIYWSKCTPKIISMPIKMYYIGFGLEYRAKNMTFMYLCISILLSLNTNFFLIKIKFLHQFCPAPRKRHWCTA